MNTTDEKMKKALRKDFYQMVNKVEKLFADYQERLEKKKTKKEQVKDNGRLKTTKENM